MRAVLDTNVLVSGLFFGGIPGRILDAWAQGQFELVVSPAIVDEYLRTCERLGDAHPGLDYEQALATFIGHATLVPDEPVEQPITADPDDDKFMLCGRYAEAVVVSGDSDLLDVAGWEGVDVVRPRAFLDFLANA